MLKIGEYRNRADRLADHLPWAGLIAPGVVLNKDGSFQRTFRFRGPDLESSIEIELMTVAARANNALRRLGSGWALFFECARVPAQGYPVSTFPDAASWLVDQERRALFSGENLEDGAKEHFENSYYLTLIYMPSADATDRAAGIFVEAADSKGKRDWRGDLARYFAATTQIHDLLLGALAELVPLDDAATLTYLHGTISTRRHPVAVPETPMYLDAVLVDTPLTGGLAPMLGDQHLRTITVRGFPATTIPGLLDALNHLGFPYRWVSRFICLDKTEATRELTKLRRQWFAKRKSVAALLREVITNEPVQLVDTDAGNKSADADEAMQALGADHVAFGYLTMTVTVVDEDAAQADAKIRDVERVVNGLGFVTILERVNAVEAWLSSLPGHVYANVRQPIIHTLNLAHILPLSAVWAGQEANGHLGGPPLFYAEAGGQTPFRFSTHIGDVGHTLIVGPTGAGKSVLLAFMALQFRRYPGAQIYLFDKGNSARAATLAMGGVHHVLGSDGTLAFQPLKRIDEPAERSWAAEWVCSLFAAEQVVITPEVKDSVWAALQNLAAAPASERTLTGYAALLQSQELRVALQPYTLEGPSGQLLDAAQDSFELPDLQCFETESLMREKALVLPVLTYLFHRLEERFDGKPTLLILDEAWVYLDNPLFVARIREWLKVLRKKNVAVLFATQSLADISDSIIAPAVIESCPQRIFLPNDRALEPQGRFAYDAFGLNARQIELIAGATPKREYYLQSRIGNRLFNLHLGSVALALCGASSPADQKLITEILSPGQADHFAKQFLGARGLLWASAALESFPGQNHKVNS